MKQLGLFLVFLLASMNMNAQDGLKHQSSGLFSSGQQVSTEDLITRQIIVKLDKAGTLSDKIGSERKYKITNLKIVGEINGDDVNFIRDLAGFSSENFQNGYESEGNLLVLDLSESQIVEGGCYVNCFRSECNTYTTNNNVIGAFFFAHCKMLKDVILPNGVVSIDHNAFDGCSNLTSISIPSTVTLIGYSAFIDCDSLINITIPSSVMSIGRSAFEGCRSLTSIAIPYGVSKIDDHTFEGCSNLVSISLPDGLTSIGICAFWGCYSLVNVILPNSICWLDEGAFSDCYNLVNITLPNNLLGLNDAVFYDCYSLTNISIPSNVRLIGDKTFYECKSFINLTIPSSVSSIGNSAFEGCSGLANIYLSWNNPLQITSNAFDGVDAKKCKVYIPKGTYDDYFISNWGEFDNLIEYDVTGIDNISTMKKAKELMWYSINGQRFNHQVKGLNIMKYCDGSVRKEIVK